MKKLLLLFLLPFGLVYSAPEVKQEIAELLAPKLNSERIAYFFGSYGVEPINIPASPFGDSRISNLYSMDGDKKIMRTLAVVKFQQPIPESLQQAHRDIAQGQSIGIALYRDGWKIDKLPIYFGSISLSPQLKAWMHEEISDRAAVHIYELNVFKEHSNERLHYCTIIEVHSPQYLDENWLQALYADQYEDHSDCSGEARTLIGALHLLIQDLCWNKE